MLSHFLRLPDLFNNPAIVKNPKLAGWLNKSWRQRIHYSISNKATCSTNFCETPSLWTTVSIAFQSLRLESGFIYILSVPHRVWPEISSPAFPRMAVAFSNTLNFHHDLHTVWQYKNLHILFAKKCVLQPTPKYSRTLQTNNSWGLTGFAAELLEARCLAEWDLTRCLFSPPSKPTFILVPNYAPPA